MKIAYYRDENDGYHGVTDECPVGFANVAYVGKGPNTLGRTDIHDIHEQAYGVARLKRWGLVDPIDVPDEWFDAIGYEQRPAPDPQPGVRYEIKDAIRSEKLDQLIKMMEAGFVLPEPEPEPEPEETKLEILPGCSGLMQDPWFWPLAIMIFVVLSSIFKGCF